MTLQIITLSLVAATAVPSAALLAMRRITIQQVFLRHRLKLPNRAGFGTEKRVKKLVSVLTLALLTFAAHAALPQPDLIAQIHFAGAQKIAADTNAALFNDQFASAEALAVRKKAADKLAPWFAGWLQAKVGAKVSGGAEKLRPLFDDLQKSEWFLEARRAANGQPQAALAIALAADRAQLWQANLKPFFPKGSFKVSGAWLLFDTGTGDLKLGDRLARQIAQPDAAWVSADVNWPLLGAWYPSLKAFGLPQTQLQLTAADASLRVNGKFFFPDNLALNLEPWRMPTNTIHQPFVSFTAARGFGGWLGSQAWAKPYSLSPGLNQLFIWALPQMAFLTFAAAPVPDATAALDQAYARLQPLFDAKQQSPNGFFAPLTLVRTNREISLRGAPYAAPFLQSVNEPSGAFLLAGAMPNLLRSKPLPPELFQRLATKNLVFYHWEFTAERMPQVLQLSQLALVMTSHRQLPGDSPVTKWIQKYQAVLGNNVTEITQTGPAEMTFTRKATGLFTASELFALGSWLESPAFPHLDLKLPPRPKGVRPRPRPAAKPPGMAVPAAPGKPAPAPAPAK